MEKFLDSLSKGTMKSYRRGLELFIEFYSKDVETILAERKDDLTPRPNENLVDAKNSYPCRQNKCPHIAIEKLRLVIECKNLSQKQVDHTLSQEWLDENIVKRPYFAKYRRKIAFFSYKPRQSSVAYLNMHGWRVYGLGTQISTLRQQKKAIGKVKQRVFWLQKEYNK